MVPRDLGRGGQSDGEGVGDRQSGGPGLKSLHVMSSHWHAKELGLSGVLVLGALYDHLLCSKKILTPGPNSDQ